MTSEYTEAQMTTTAHVTKLGDDDDDNDDDGGRTKRWQMIMLIATKR